MISTEDLEEKPIDVTVARELQKKIGSNTLLISQDVIRREMLMVKDGPDTKALPMLKVMAETIAKLLFWKEFWLLIGIDLCLKWQKTYTEITFMPTILTSLLKRP